MKKFCLNLVVAAACLVSGIVFADPYTEAMAPITDNYFNGLYLGASMGVSYLTNDEKNVGTAEVCTPYPFCYTSIEKKQIHGNKISTIVNIFLGYSKILHQEYYLGGEIFAQHSPLTLNFSWDSRASPYAPIFTYINKIKTICFYGALIKGGCLISKRTLFYLLLGYEGIHLKMQHFIAEKPAPGRDYIIKNRKTVYKAANGVIGGLGLEAYLTQRFSLITQYTHTFFGSTTYKNSTTVSTHPVTHEAKDNFQLGVFSIGFIYHLA